MLCAQTASRVAVYKRNPAAILPPTVPKRLPPLRALRDVVVAHVDDPTQSLTAKVDTLGGKLYEVSIPRHDLLGFVLAEKNGRIVVDEVTPGGQAEHAGVKVGDVLHLTTARLPAEDEPDSVSTHHTAKEGFFGEVVLFNTAGESFHTVSSAINSNRVSHSLITMVLERPPGRD